MEEAKPIIWARVADAAALGALALGLLVLLFGGLVLYLGPVPLRVYSAGRLLFAAVAIITIRHVASPAVPLHRRILRALRSGGAESAASIARVSLLNRVLILVVGYFAVVVLKHHAEFLRRAIRYPYHPCQTISLDVSSSNGSPSPELRPRCRYIGYPRAHKAGARRNARRSRHSPPPRGRRSKPW